MKRTVPPHDPMTSMKNAPNATCVTLETSSRFTQMPEGFFGCVGCGGGWDGVLVTDRRGRMWHASCAEGALAAFERVDESRGLNFKAGTGNGYLFKASLIDNLVTEELEQRLNDVFETKTETT